MRSAHVSSSFANLAELVEGGPGNPLAKPGSSSALSADSSGARSEDRPDRLIIVSNQLPVRMKRRDGPSPPGAQHTWEFEWDEDSLVGQAKAGIEQPQFQAIQVLYVGGLPHEVPSGEQDAVSSDLFSRFCCLPGAWPPRKATPGLLIRGHSPVTQRCLPPRMCTLTRHPLACSTVYLGAELKERFYTARVPSASASRPCVRQWPAKPNTLSRPACPLSTLSASASRPCGR